MERLVFGLEYQNAAGEEVETFFVADGNGFYSIEEVRVIPCFKAGGAAYGYSGDAVGEYHVTVDVRNAPFTKYAASNDNSCPKWCLKVNLLAVCSHLARYFCSRISLGFLRKSNAYEEVGKSRRKLSLRR